MDGYKHIEHCCGAFIASHYKNPVEVGVGDNPDAAQCIHEAGSASGPPISARAGLPPWLSFARDDIFRPTFPVMRAPTSCMPFARQKR